jgi:hypothetical protein
VKRVALVWVCLCASCGHMTAEDWQIQIAATNDGVVGGISGAAATLILAKIFAPPKHKKKKHVKLPDGGVAEEAHEDAEDDEK